MEFWEIAVYLLPALAVTGLYLGRRRRIETAHKLTLSEAIESGLTEPVTLHPVIDPARCVGSASCVKVCPEQALGIIDGKAQLVDPAACIGHGACAAHCPVEAIRLVFGTETRGVDIPQVSPTFETNVPGLFIAGELGGMGLIRKAAEQGRQAMEAIGARTEALNARDPDSRTDLDVIIVGAGPAGLAASLAAKQKGLRFLTIEQEESLGGAILHFPRNKIAMTAPMQLPIVGKVTWREISKESLLEFWNGVMQDTGLPVRFGERMVGLQPKGSRFCVKTPQSTYMAGSVLLSIGRRGTPRKLDVPGEDLDKVVYRLLDPHQYSGMRVLVIGGGDTAIEAALAISEAPNAEVLLSYRGKSFSRVKPRNRRRLEDALALHRLRTLMESEITAIDREYVTVARAGEQIRLANDAVIVCAGGVLPAPMLREIGILIQTHYGAEVRVD